MSGVIPTSSMFLPLGLYRFQIVYFSDAQSSKSSIVCIDPFQKLWVHIIFAFICSCKASAIISQADAVYQSINTTIGFWKTSYHLE